MTTKIKQMFEELKSFRKTSIFRYLLNGDWKNVRRKIRVFCIMNIRNPIVDFYWSIRYVTINRYHVIKPPIRPGWHDTDDLIEQCVFHLFKKHIDEERDGLEGLQKEIDDFVRESQVPELEQSERENFIDAARMKEDMRQVYIYITKERSLLEEKDPYGISMVLYNKDTEMLCRIMKFRGKLWI